MLPHDAFSVSYSAANVPRKKLATACAWKYACAPLETNRSAA